ncbi:alpha-ketoglutarate-dependent dioxygenase AlkB family protein [Flammeovirga pacifica]|uniref:Alpha-ketoglutarate-dependent dioxygenase AlkB n=1 Tax=Flammeovirga pacifica TaxID=915059 RepID=A0A1S1YTB7_FLAPC|nr:alpha-ketoglutarate-dependent dioxygenase AlkB [Flammeovirga pacifica]OHX64103.1 alpha-ketoglutarate-dependent dioxygenase AlkB [Flammeovirga pacifica]
MDGEVGNIYMITPQLNILPYDGKLEYYPSIFSAEEKEYYYNNLFHKIAWENDVIKMFGKEFITKRKVGWYGLKNYEYTYSKSTKRAHPFPVFLQDILNKVEHYSKESFNSCLLNLYHSGEEGMAYHSDNEKELKKNGCIASVSFGAERKFSFKHKTSKERIDINLENGSLLLMSGEIQDKWMHALPKTKRIDTPRINLTFRTIIT